VVVLIQVKIAETEDFRGEHIGQVVTMQLVRIAKEKGYKEIYLNAQYYLLDYYKKLDFIL
jgi:predicted GNAT family N-acyltransferase